MPSQKKDFYFLLGIYGGLVAGTLSGILSADEFIAGARDTFRPFSVFVCLVKSVTFAFIITS
ncbi:MAG: ABC transporter permease, partial [Bacteroidales bacterium]|nr:ABC transporter permease [Bacteroidales bacterium]